MNRVIWRSGDRVIGKIPTLVLSSVLCCLGAHAQAPEGIPRDFAQARAQQIQDVRYQLRFGLTPKADSAAGHEELRFVLKQDDKNSGPQWLDFRGGAVSGLIINGQPAPANLVNGHLELPAKLLHSGENTVAMDFTAPIGPAGKAITRFEDKDDGSEYLYTLFVPMDAEMAFPCFDQPDLKAKFRLTITAPKEWTVISNTAVEQSTDDPSSGKVTVFQETKPISTYLFAFAAGPFVKVDDVAGLPGFYVRKSKLKQAETEAPDVQQIAAQGIKYLTAYFAQPFPFPKYDQILIPGFAYGGMEHAGATFLREESVLFRQVPTHNDRIGRDILVLHELTHQWFGDLVTMRWFDDLWLKEGFAQYMAYHALADLKPNENAWKRFYQSMKPAAYRIDSTQGTTPIYQDISNLKDAKSAYGAIVYSKAPGVLKQLAFVIGEQNFRDGLRLYLKEHAYGNAEWNDLVHAFERTSGKSLQAWADAWIKRRGMPQVDVSWSCDAKTNQAVINVRQHDVLNEGTIWPISTQLLIHERGINRTQPISFSTTKTANYVRPGCPDYIFGNDDDYAYGRFLLDPRSQKAVMERLGSIDDVFERTLLWGSLWDSVREAELDPREYTELALKLLPQEKDQVLAQSLIGHVVTSLHRYMSPEARASLAAKAEALAYDQMLHQPEQDMRIIWYRGLRGMAETPEGRGHLKDLLSGKLTVPGVQLRQLDRWSIVESLIAQNDPDAAAILAAEERRDPSGEGRKYAYMAQAARPDEASKKQYFNDYLQNASRPEDWVADSLDSFNYWNQSELTFKYLRPALDALGQVKRERKIFFLLAWLNAFIGGQRSAEAQAQVHEFLKTEQLDKDLRLKILEVVDELDRTVKIREKYK